MIPRTPTRAGDNGRRSEPWLGNDVEKTLTPWSVALPSPDLPSTDDLDAYVAKAAEEEKARRQTSK